MKSKFKYLFLTVVLTLTGLGGLRAGDQSGLPVTVFRHVNILSMESENILFDQAVFVQKGVIVGIKPDQLAVNPDGATVINGSGAYLLPGLADMHVHCEASGFPLFLANGITTIRELNGSPDHLKWREQITSGQLVGPHLYVSSPLLAGVKQRYRHIIITDPAVAGNIVRDLAKQGYDFIKVYDGLSREVYDQIVKTAGDVGIPVVGHIPREVGLEHAIESKQKSIEHAEQIEYAAASVRNPITQPQALKIADEIAHAGIWVTPTLASQEALTRGGTLWYADQLGRPEMKFVDSETIGWWSSLKRSHSQTDSDPNSEFGSPIDREFFHSMQGLVKAFERGHVRLLAGTDTPNPLMIPGFSLHEELRNLKAAGLTNFELLQTATVNAADFLGDSKNAGTISVGKRADLVLVNGNPLENLDTLRNPIGVMVFGKWMAREELQSMIRQK